jgi:hypothetical protein
LATPRLDLARSSLPTPQDVQPDILIAACAVLRRCHLSVAPTRKWCIACSRCCIQNSPSHSCARRQTIPSPAAGSDPPFTKTRFFTNAMVGASPALLASSSSYCRLPMIISQSGFLNGLPCWQQRSVKKQPGIIKLRVSKPATLRKAKQLHETCDSTELVEVLQTTIYSLGDCGWSQRRIASE